jgi:hypothetical protein
MVLTCKENARKQTATENFRMGPEGKRRRGRNKERWIGGVRWSVTNHGLTEEDTIVGDRWRNLVLGEGKPL